jgi:hypothetical protein
MGWLGDAPRDVAIVIDASYSMGYDTGRQTVWDKSLGMARAILEGLGDNDRFCLFLAKEQPEALIAEPIGDTEQGLNRLKGLKPGTGTSQLAPAITEAIKALRKDGRQREQEIYVLTDNQALPWQGFGSAAAESEDAPPESAANLPDWDSTLLDERTTVFVLPLGVAEPENVGPDSMEMIPALIQRGAAAQVTASLFQSGEAAESAVTLFVNDEQIGRRPVRLGAMDGDGPSFSLPPLPPGIHSGRLETPGDNLSIDNSFHFLIRVEDRMPALCIGSEEDTLFVRTALEAGIGGGGKVTDIIAPERAGEKQFEDYACIYLCNAIPLPGQALIALEQYVRGGGLLVVFPGLRANPDAYQPWTCLPGKPRAIAQTSFAERARTLAWDNPAHPMIRPLRQGASVPSLTVRRHLVWAEGDLANDTQRLISMGAERPFLLERPFGEGRVLMFALSADRTWSDFPLSPFYLPVITQCLDYSAGFGAKSPFIWATDSLSLNERLPEATRGATLRDPDNQTVAIRSTVVEGRTLVVAEDLTRPGIYEISTRDRPLGTPALAVNLPRRESDLTPLSNEEMARRLGTEKIFFASDRETLQQIIEEHRIGRTYGEHLLWLALILIGIEFFYANALLRSGPRLSDQLKVDLSGHVKGHLAEAASK